MVDFVKETLSSTPGTCCIMRISHIQSLSLNIFNKL